MFAKVFGQIFDSSIAEDYNCRRMFMDLLVLADSDGAVDMTPEAISRRTNVPIDEVQKYIGELCQPDPLSRSKLHEGKRLIPLDSQRGWGWQIVNYAHYREIRDEAARREYFRDKQRERRRKLRGVKDKGLTGVDKVEQVLTPASASSSTSSVRERDSKGKPKDAASVIAYAREIGLPEADGHYYWDKWQAGGYVNAGKPIKDWQALIRSHKSAGYCPSQKRGVGASSFQKVRQQQETHKKVDPSKIDVPERFKSWAAENYPDRRETIMKYQTWADVPQSLRQEWWKEEKPKYGLA